MTFVWTIRICSYTVAMKKKMKEKKSVKCHYSEFNTTSV